MTATNYTITVSTSAAMTSPTTVTTTALSTTITGLTPSTEYYYTIYGANGALAGPVSAVQSNTTAAASSTGPVVSGTFVNVNFAAPTGQTVSQYVWGVAAQDITFCATSALQSLFRTLNFPLYRFNATIDLAETAFPSGATTATPAVMASTFGPMINTVPLAVSSTARIIIGLGDAPNNWPTAAAYGQMCGAVATYFNTTNSTATGVPLPIYGFEVGNEEDGGSGTAPSYYNAYFNAASVAIKAVNPNYNMFGPVFSYVSDVSGFTSGCAGHYDALDYHYYQYFDQSGFTSIGGLSGVLSGATYFGTDVSGAVSGTTPILIGEYNQNATYGTNTGGASPGICNTYMQNIAGAVFNAQCILSGINATNNFQMGAVWEAYQDSDYGVVGGADVAGGGNNVAPGGYLLSKAAATLYGPRVSCSLGSANPVLNCIAVSGGPGAGHFAVMLINYGLTTAYTGQVALSAWPINGTGTASITNWTISPASPSGVVTSLAVTAGLTASLTVPAESVVVLYV